MYCHSIQILLFSVILEFDSSLLDRRQLYAAVFKEQAAVLRASHSHIKGDRLMHGSGDYRFNNDLVCLCVIGSR